MRVRGARSPPFTISTITYFKLVVYAPAKRANIQPLFLLYPYMYSVVLPFDLGRRECMAHRPRYGKLDGRQVLVLNLNQFVQSK